jgi:hypothetical protein
MCASDPSAQVNVVEFSSTAKQMLKSEYLKFRDRSSGRARVRVTRCPVLMRASGPP